MNKTSVSIIRSRILGKTNSFLLVLFFVFPPSLTFYYTFSSFFVHFFLFSETTCQDLWKISLWENWVYHESFFYLNLGDISSIPPMNGLNGYGIITEPSSCWKFSSKHTSILGTAHAVAFNVWTNLVVARLALPFLEVAEDGSDGRYRIPSRRLW